MFEPADIKIFLVDDHPVVRDGVSLLLSQKGFVVCGEADNCADALQLMAASPPDIVLIDLSLGDESGLDIISEIQDGPMKILVYSMHRDVRHIKAAFAAGAHGYVTKREIATTLVDAIAATLAGERYLSPLATQAIGDARPEERSTAMTRLSEREWDVFRLIGEGYSTAQLADHFDISNSSVQTYYVRIMDKLGLSGVKELRRHAITAAK